MKHTRIILLIALLCVAAVGLPSLDGATITVISTNEDGPGSLRQAMADAHDGDTINFSLPLPVTIFLFNGPLIVDKDVTIDGPGADMLALDSYENGSVCSITSGKTDTISGLTITNGGSPRGGGIYNDHATLTVSSCAISHNHNGGPITGGGIYNDGSGESGVGALLTIVNSTLSGNSSFEGGAIYNGGGPAAAPHYRL
jgi:hypothetical protein